MRVEHRRLAWLIPAAMLASAPWTNAVHGQLPPDGHPVYETPELLKHVLEPLESRTAYLGGPPKSLNWAWKPDREEYFVGEPLSGTLTVSNPAANQRDRFTFVYELSPPGNDTFVSTLAVWRGPADGGWDTLRPIIRVNGGAARIRRGAQGRPVVIRPGESFRFPVTLNTGLSDKWRYARGFQTPGQHRVFVRYQNLEPMLPFLGDTGVAGRDEKAPDEPSEIVLRPTAPVVIGPIGAEIGRLPVRLSAILHPLMPAEGASDHEDEGHVHGKGPLAVEEALRLLADDSLQDDQLSGLRQAATIEAHFARVRESTNSLNRVAELNQLLELARQVAREVTFSGGTQRLALLECKILEELDRGEEALRRAREILETTDVQMPDLTVFVALAPERAEQRRVAAAESLDADTGPLSVELLASDGELGEPLRIRVSCRNGSRDQTIGLRPLSYRSAGVAKRTVSILLRPATKPEAAFVRIDEPIPPHASTAWSFGAFVATMPPGRQYSLSADLMYDWSDASDPTILFESAGEYEIVAEYRPMSDPRTDDVLRSQVVRIRVRPPTSPERTTDWVRFKEFERGWLAFAPEQLSADPRAFKSVVAEFRRFRSEGNEESAIRRAVDATVDFADYLAARDEGDDQELARISARFNGASDSALSVGVEVADPATRLSRIVRAEVESTLALHGLERFAAERSRSGEMVRAKTNARPFASRVGDWIPPKHPPSWFGNETGIALTGPFVLQDLGRQLEISFNRGREGPRSVRFHGVDERSLLHHAKRGYAAATLVRGVPQGATDVSTRPLSLRAVPVAAGAVTVLVNHQLAVEELTIAQLKTIFSGRTERWDEVVPGIEDLDIEVYTPVHGSYATEIVRDMVLLGEPFATVTTDLSMVAERQRPTGQEMVTAVGQNPGAIGFLLSTTVVDFPPTVRVISVASNEGALAILPDRTSIEGGLYPLAQSVFLVLPPQVDATTNEFVSFVSASRAKSLFETSGLLPLEMAAEQRSLWIPPDAHATQPPRTEFGESANPTRSDPPFGTSVVASKAESRTDEPGNGFFAVAVVGVVLLICWFVAAKNREGRAKNRERRRPSS